MKIFTFTIFLILPLLVQAKNKFHENNNSSRSLWLRRATNPRQAQGSCRKQPWICRGDHDSPGIKRICCKDQCVDLRTDVNNCGLCGFRCKFAWTCCRGMCVNTNVNPFHCGNCDRKCPFLVFCFYGMCGYAQPFPPKPPFPFPPKPPFPFPPKPPHPWPKPGPPKPWPWPKPDPHKPYTPPAV